MTLIFDKNISTFVYLLKRLMRLLILQLFLMLWIKYAVMFEPKKKTTGDQSTFLTTKTFENSTN